MQIRGEQKNAIGHRLKTCLGVYHLFKYISVCLKLFFLDTIDLQIGYRKQLTLFGSIPRVSIVRTIARYNVRIRVVLKIGKKRDFFSIPIQFIVIYTTHKVSYFHYLSSYLVIRPNKVFTYYNVFIWICFKRSQ